MLALPLALVVLGYWVMYSGVKKASLLDSWRCTPVVNQTPVSEPPGTVTRTPQTTPPNVNPITNSQCQIRAGDTRIPIPGSSQYWILRPQGAGFLGVLTAQLVGPC